MQEYIKLQENESGDLLITLTEEGKEELPEIIQRNSFYAGVWTDLLESIICNSETEFIRPEQIGALTDSPIIGLNVSLDDDGKIEEREDTKFFWFPDYQVIDEFNELLTKGQIVFTKAQ